MGLGERERKKIKRDKKKGGRGAERKEGMVGGGEEDREEKDKSGMAEIRR